MLFLDARVMPGLLLAGTVEEARLVWRHIGRLAGLRAAVVLADHLHVATDDAPGMDQLRRFLERLHIALNRSRRRRGPLWRPGETRPALSSGRTHERRKVRYCSLNPCRGGHGYVQDPLEWPWSTHRDLVGLSFDPIVPPHPSPEKFHAYCTRDSDLAIAGSRLPEGPAEGKIEGLTFRVLLARVSSLYRVTPEEVLGNARRRRFLLGAARALLDARASVIARAAGVHRSTVLRTPEPPPGKLAIVRAVARDRRFYPWTNALYGERALAPRSGKRPPPPPPT